MDKTKYVPVREIAQYFEVTDAAIYKWVSLGRIRAFRLGRMVRIPREEFEYLKVYGLRDAKKSDDDNAPDRGIVPESKRSLASATV